MNTRLRALLLFAAVALLFSCGSAGSDHPSDGYTGKPITTIAGTSAQGSAGDNGPATAASLGLPSGLCLDSAGNLYIADQFSNKVRAISTAGTISLLAGNGTAAFAGDTTSAPASELYSPIATASYGSSIYIADTINNRIRVVSAGTINTFAGNGAVSYNGDNMAATAAAIAFPSGVCTDSNGNIYIADSTNSRIRKVTMPAGTITTYAGNGNPGYTGDNGAATSAQLNYPTGIVCDPSGNVYFCDCFNNVVRKISTSGTITTYAGNGTPSFAGDGGLATAASLYHPQALALDTAGNLYIADQLNSRIRLVDTAGTISTYAGDGYPGFTGDGGDPTKASLNFPMGLAYDAATDALYIADTYNFRIRVIK